MIILIDGDTLIEQSATRLAMDLQLEFLNYAHHNIIWRLEIILSIQ